MTVPPRPRPPEGAAVSFPTLEARYGPLRRVNSGMQSRVYANRAGDLMLKIYRTQQGEHQLEARNMVQAGMGEWVVGTAEADGVEALVLRRFAGQALTAADVPRALPGLREQLSRLHRERRGEVDLARLHARVLRFRSALAAYPLEDLFVAVEEPLAAGLMSAPAAFCHLDLWHGNILMGPGGDVLLIDWTKAGWDDPLRDLALLKTGTLDLLPADQSLQAALSLLPAQDAATLARFRAYLALTTLHDLYWFLMKEPYEFEDQKNQKVPRARHALVRLPG